MYQVTFLLCMRFVLKCEVYEPCTFWDTDNCCLPGAGKELLWQHALSLMIIVRIPFRVHATLLLTAIKENYYTWWAMSSDHYDNFFVMGI